MAEHERALDAIRRAVTGINVPSGELQWALEHLGACETCTARFEDERTPACERVEELLPDAARLVRDGGDPARDWPEVARHLEECERCAAIVAALAQEPKEAAEVAEGSVDPDQLFERALVPGLTDPDRVVRVRAAARLGERRRVGAEALAALAERASEDPDERVREAALTALDQLDEAVSIPQRLIEAWSASPAEAAPFVAGVLARLAGEPPPRDRGVTELVVAEAPEEGRLVLTGKKGITGYLVEERSRLWLTLNRLPSELENKRPVVALPEALASRSASVRWASAERGLIPSKERVEGGSLRIQLGQIAKVGVAEKEKSLRRIYLLNPEARREQAR
jgi:hypothetical protein